MNTISCIPVHLSWSSRQYSWQTHIRGFCFSPTLRPYGLQIVGRGQEPSFIIDKFPALYRSSLIALPPPHPGLLPPHPELPSPSSVLIPGNKPGSILCCLCQILQCYRLPPAEQPFPIPARDAGSQWNSELYPSFWHPLHTSLLCPLLVVKHADTKPVLPVFHNFYFCICVFYHQDLFFGEKIDKTRGKRTEASPNPVLLYT